MNKDQLWGIIERAATVIATIFLAKLVRLGWLSDTDSAALLPLLVLLPSLIYGFWINRDKALVQSAAAIPGTVVVTTPKLASDTPEKNIVSNLEATVVADANKGGTL